MNPFKFLLSGGLTPMVETGKMCRVNASIAETASDLQEAGQGYLIGCLRKLNAFYFDTLLTSQKDFAELPSKKSLELLEASTDSFKAGQQYWLSVLMYFNEFMEPFWTTVDSFLDQEKDKLAQGRFDQTAMDYMDLLLFSIKLADKHMTGTLKGAGDFNITEVNRAYEAWVNTVLNRKGENLTEYTAGLAKLTDKIVCEYPQAIKDVKGKFGFQFDTGRYIKAAETDRFLLYQVLPRDNNIETRKNGKPVIIVPPFVLGVNILSFLPDEGKSYVHAFADQGIPTYIRVTKDIAETPAVQKMTCEDDAADMKYLCEKIKAAHGRPVTLNGYCQGGYTTLIDILSGKLDGLVDALITCVTPIDGSRSKSLIDYINLLPARFRDLGYALKNLPNGAQVCDGKVMGWFYKLRSMEKEAPLATLYRDMMSFEIARGKEEVPITTTAAALNHWVIYDRADIPEEITKISHISYMKPIDKKGNLPVKMFGKKLNIKYIKEKGIKWLLCLAEKDDLVDGKAGLAPLDYIDDVELSVFPKGHVAIATSWSHPDSACALHTRFGPKNYRGPVRYQLDLEKEENEKN